MSVIEHGGPGCTCVTDPEAFGFGEDPECPHHGYEAVIRRLTQENERLTDQHQGAVAPVWAYVAALEQEREGDRRGERALAELREAAEAALPRPGGQ